VTEPVRVVFVVAAAENGVIGRNGRLPWRMPTDLKQFRKLTLGKPIIMGRKTYDSLGKPLDGRDNIVLTRRPGTFPAGVHVARSAQEAMALARRLAAARQVDEVAVIGGAEIFLATLPFTDRIYLTRVHAHPDGDVTFKIDWSQWAETARTPMPKGEKDQHTADFIVLQRKS
jgi:dihydrofolate reductase